MEASLVAVEGFLVVEEASLAVGHTVVWAAVDIDAVAHLPGKCRVLAEVVDTPAHRVDKAGLVAGIVEAVVDLP